MRRKNGQGGDERRPLLARRVFAIPAHRTDILTVQKYLLVPSGTFWWPPQKGEKGENASKTFSLTVQQALRARPLRHPPVK